MGTREHIHSRTHAPVWKYTMEEINHAISIAAFSIRYP